MLLVAAALHLAGLTGRAGAERPPGLSNSPVAKALAQPIDLDFEKTSFDNVLKYIDEVCPDVRIVIDPAVSAGGIDLSTRVVDLKMRQVTVRAVLDLLLGDDLAYRSDGEYVLVTTHDRALRNMSALMYPVDGLIRRLSADAAYGTGGSRGPRATHAAATAESWERTPASELVDVVQRLINHTSDQGPASWADEGGAATIVYVNGALVVRQTAVGQQRLAEALATIGKALDVAVRSEEMQRPRSVQPVVAPAESKAVAETRRHLDEAIDLDFEKTSLDNVLKYIDEVERGLNIVVDPALATAGIDLNTRVVDLKCKRLSLRAVLSLVLRPDTGFTLGPGYVLVTTREKIHTGLALKAYPVADLAKAGADERFTRGRLSRSARMLRGQWELVDIVQRLVNNQADPLVAVWADEGGLAAFEILGGSLLITQSEHGHARTLHVLNALRAVTAADPAKTAAPVPASPEHEAVEQTWRRLAQPIDVELDQTPLAAGLASLARRRPDLNLVIDPAVAASGIDLSTRTATLRLRQVPTASVLGLLLAHDLGYCVEAGYVCVTPRERTQSDLPAVVYPVGDVVRALRETAVWRSWQNLIDAIQRCVNHCEDPGVAAWSVEGGAAVIEYFGRTLVVTQTRRGHARLAALLGTLRQALAWQQARQAMGVEPAQKVLPVSDQQAAAAAPRLETPVHVSLYGLSLDRAVLALSQSQPGLNVVLDAGLGKAGIDPAACRVATEPGPTTLGGVLRQILTPWMGFYAGPGYVLVTTYEARLQRLPLVLYPAADLLDGELVRRGKALAEVTEIEFDAVFDELAAGIKRQVNFESDHDVAAWSSEGGPGTLMELGDVLLISQTPRGHARVVAYLNDLRAGW